MRIERVVVNASPLIILCKGNLAHLFSQLFAEVIVSARVWDEVIMAGGAHKTQPRKPCRRRLGRVASK